MQSFKQGTTSKKNILIHCLSSDYELIFNSLDFQFKPDF